MSISLEDLTVADRVREYEERKKHFEEELQINKKSISTIGNLRLLTFIIGAGATFYMAYFVKNYVISTIMLIAFTALFIYLVYSHIKALKSKAYCEVLIEINEEGIKRASGAWREFKDNGEEFKDENHGYSGDLDIFGKSSLFQWINTCSTFDGRKQLAYMLTNPLKKVEEVKERQLAVKELSEKLAWRQEFSAEGRLISDKSKNPEKLTKWALLAHDLYLNKNVIAVCSFLPIATVLSLLMSYGFNLFSYKIALVAVAVQIIMLIPRQVERVLALETVYLFKENVVSYEKILSSIENQEFKSEYLKKLKDRLASEHGKNATKGIRELQNISDKISDRRNLFYIVINILFLWDYQCMFKLERWKKEYGSSLQKWLEVIGEIEALSSLSVIAYDNETWIMPEVKEDGEIIKARSMGHPLLGTGAVKNDVTMENPTSIILITGSNMSGKSTLLRTIGINIILSYIGSPVCAEQFSCSLMNVYTCMRIGDNLEKSISSFYAEILRIKMIVKAAKDGEKVFFLLDEIFKGTNSVDRHTGAKVLIKQLGESGAAGLVSTHDLELGDMEKEYKKIKNYHFQEHYENGELKFDYKLKRGISTTRNALYIIKMAGIDVDNFK
jgi:DNA mismatch repair ATPase MutS